MQEETTNNDIKKWNKVYKKRPEDLPWFGVGMPIEVNDFLETLQKEDSMLVTGCGFGDTAKTIKVKGFKHVVGTDISSVAIEEAKRRFQDIAFEVIRTEELGSKVEFKEVNVFDWLNLHQISNTQLEGYLAGLASVAKNLCLVWIYDSSEVAFKKSYVHEGNVYHHNPKTVSELLSKNGLTLKNEFPHSFNVVFYNVQHEHRAVGQIYAK